MLLAGIAVLVWLGKSKMGVMRYLANKNRLWNGSPVSFLFPLAVCVTMAALAVWAAAMLLRKKAHPKGHGFCFARSALPQQFLRRCLAQAAFGLTILLARPARLSRCCRCVCTGEQGPP